MKPTINFNPTQATTDILKTVLLLEKHYGASYIARIVQGFDGYGLRKEAHRDLETFGSLKGLFRERIINLIFFMLKEDYLEIANIEYGNLRISEKGQLFLDHPEAYTIPKGAIKTREIDRLIMAEMKEIRKQLSDDAEIAPYEVFTDYTMQCIVIDKPENVVELKRIPGIGDAKTDQFGHLILEAIQRIKKLMKERAKVRRMYKAKSPSHQSVKTLFNEGKSIAEICKVRGIKPVTVIRYLETLHLTGDVDLTNWIETQVNAKDLHKGAAYFKQVESPKLKEALEVLGLDFETLRLCRLYVSNATSKEEELGAAA